MKYYQLISKFITVIFLLSGSSISYAQLTVFACEPEWGALAKEIGGDNVKVVTATTAMQDPHHIQARPSLISKIRRADLLACTGAELETGWLPVLLRKSSNSKIQRGKPGYFMAAKQVILLDKPTVLDRSMGDVHAAGNPHIQFSPYRIAKVALAMANTLVSIDASHQSDYQQNLHHFLTDWQQAINQWEQKTKSLRGKTFVAHHNNWVYLAHWLGLKRIATLEPKPGVPPSASHLAAVLAKVKQNPPDFIIYSSYQSDKASNWLSEKIATPAIAIPFSVSEDETLSHWYDRFINQLIEKKL